MCDGREANCRRGEGSFVKWHGWRWCRRCQHFPRGERDVGGYRLWVALLLARHHRGRVKGEDALPVGFSWLVVRVGHSVL